MSTSVSAAALSTALGGCDGTVDALVDVIEENGIGAVDQMDEELAVPLRSWQPGVYDAHGRATPVERRVDDLAQDPGVDLGVADDTAPADLVLARLELRLHEHDGVPARLEQPQHGRQGDPDADEGDVRDEQLGAKGQLGQLPRIRSL